MTRWRWSRGTCASCTRARELGFELLRAPPRPGSPAAAETVAAYRRGLELAPGAPDEVLNQLVQANAAILPWPGFDPNRSVATPRGSACDELRLPPRVGLDDGLELLGEDACRAIAGLGDALEAIVAARVDGARVDPMSMESAWSFEGTSHLP